ncbi:MAG: hypothetical protein ACOYOK_15005 [Pseudobdellovibrionaceae bacterium]
MNYIIISIFLAIFNLAGLASAFADVKPELSLSQNKTIAAQRKLAGGPGVDGSGGNSLQSSEEEVKQAFTKVYLALPSQLRWLNFHNHRDQMGWNYFNDKNHIIHDFKFGKGAFQIVHDFLLIDKKIMNLINTSESDTETPDPSSPINPAFDKDIKSRLVQGVLQKKITFNLVSGECNSRQGHRDGAAIGTPEAGTICLSLSRLQKIPTDDLENQIVALIMHELSHLSGFNEKKAIAFQKLIYNNPGLYNSKNTNPVKTFRSCDEAKIRKEIDNLMQSVYWHQKYLDLSNLFDGSIKICSISNDGRRSGLKNDTRLTAEWFADEAERYTDMYKFIVNNSNFKTNEEYQGVNDNIAKDLMDFWLDSDTYTLNLKMKVPTGVFTKIAAKISTDAQCHPKVLLSNIIAVTELMLDDQNQSICSDSQWQGGGGTEAAKAWVKKIKNTQAREQQILLEDPGAQAK